MRRLRNDLPYTFRPPVDRSWIRPAGMWVNRHIHLGRKYRITRIEEKGMGDVESLCAQEHSVLLAPNHSDHSDPHVLMELCGRHGLRPTFMGARRNLRGERDHRMGAAIDGRLFGGSRRT